MATASFVREVREVVKPVMESVEQVVLTLDPIEAEFLSDLLGASIQGHPEDSARKYADSIAKALVDGGVRPWYEIREDDNTPFPMRKSADSIYYWGGWVDETMNNKKAGRHA